MNESNILLAVRQLHREFLRAGSDVMQAFTFYASDDKLENRGNEAQSKYTVSAFNFHSSGDVLKIQKEGCVLHRGGLFSGSGHQPGSVRPGAGGGGRGGRPDAGRDLPNAVLPQREG